MSNKRLEEIRKKFLASRDVSDEVELLLERLRTGDLSSVQLEIAAHCRYPAAELALARQPITSLLSTEWVDLLERFEKHAEIAARLALAILRSVAKVTSTNSSDAEVQVYMEVDKCLSRWIACPCSEHVTEANVVGEMAVELVHDLTYEAYLAKPGDGPTFLLALIASKCADVPDNWRNLAAVLDSATLVFGGDLTGAVSMVVSGDVCRIIGEWALRSGKDRQGNEPPVHVSNTS